MKNLSIKEFFNNLQMSKNIEISVKDIINITTLHNNEIKKFFNEISYAEKNNIYAIITDIAQKEIEKSTNLSDTLYWQLKLIYKINDEKFWDILNKKIKFINYIENYFDILYSLIKEKYIRPSLEFYIKTFNEKYDNFSDKIKEIFFILFLERIALDYNIDKKIGYTRIHWNDIFDINFKKRFLLALIFIYNYTQTYKDKILNLLMTLDNFIYIYIDIFSDLINKIQFLNIKNNIDYRNQIYDLLEDEEKLTVEDKKNILNVLKNKNLNINFNFYIILFLLNIFVYKIKNDKDLINFKKEMYSNHIDIGILTTELLKLPLINYNEDYELIYIINLGSENKYIDSKICIKRLIKLLNKKLIKEEPLFILKNELIKDEIPGYEEWKNYQLLNKLKFLFQNYPKELKDFNYNEYYEKLIYFLKKKAVNEQKK